MVEKKKRQKLFKKRYIFKIRLLEFGKTYQIYVCVGLPTRAPALAPIFISLVVDKKLMSLLKFWKLNKICSGLQKNSSGRKSTSKTLN